MTWFAAYTWPRMEAVANESLRWQGYRTFYPFRREQVKRKLPNRTSFRLIWVERPYFERYLFFAMEGRDGESFAQINATAGITTTVNLGDAPLRIPDRVMDELLGRAGEDGLMGVISASDRRRFAPGQRVRFIGDTPFAGLVAAIAVDSGDEVRLWLEMLGETREVTAPPSAIEAAE
jgi:transcription antitermination factor NusG